MPRQTKRKRQLQEAREAKRLKLDLIDQADGEQGEQDTERSNEPPTLSLSDYDSETFDPESEDLGEESKIHVHAQDWIGNLSRDDLLSLTTVLYHLLVSMLNFKSTYAAKLISSVIGKNDRTIRGWIATFLVNGGDTLQGKIPADMSTCTSNQEH